MVKSHTPTADFDSEYRKRGAYHWDYYGSDPDYTREVDATVEFFRDKSGTLLEVGCGDGVLLHLLGQNRNLACIGIDTSFTAIKLAYERGLYNCIVDTIDRALFTYDYVVMDNVLEHMEDYEGALDHVVRLMGDDGVFYFISPIQGDPLPMDYHAFTEMDLFMILERRFVIDDYRRTPTNMRFVCRRKHEDTP